MIIEVWALGGVVCLSVAMIRSQLNSQRKLHALADQIWETSCRVARVESYLGLDINEEEEDADLQESSGPA